MRPPTTSSPVPGSMLQFPVATSTGVQRSLAACQDPRPVPSQPPRQVPQLLRPTYRVVCRRLQIVQQQRVAFDISNEGGAPRNQSAGFKRSSISIRGLDLAAISAQRRRDGVGGNVSELNVGQRENAPADLPRIEHGLDVGSPYGRHLSRCEGLKLSSGRRARRELAIDRRVEALEGRAHFRRHFFVSRFPGRAADEHQRRHRSERNTGSEPTEHAGRLREPSGPAGGFSTGRAERRGLLATLASEIHPRNL